MGFAGDTHEIFGGDLGKNLTLLEFTPREGKLVERFRKFVKDTFGGPMFLFAVLDPLTQKNVTRDIFTNYLKQHMETVHEVSFSDAELDEIFYCADVDGNGVISKQEAVFIEMSAEVRETEIFKIKINRREQHQRLMAWSYIEDGRRGLPATHRLSRRPWLADTFEKLPVLVCKRRMEWKQQAYRKSLAARITFIRHLKNKYGNEVRAWRRALDPDCKFVFTLKSLRRYCSSVDLQVDIQALWKSLDKDDDGGFRLEELCVRASLVLAGFQDWAKSHYESCAGCWDCPRMDAARAKPQQGINGTWASIKKMLSNAFGDALSEMGWPGAADPKTRQVLLSSLDYLGCGFISRTDLEWLDKWVPPEFLTVQGPDYEALAELRKLMLGIYERPLRAWRNLLDLDNSNHVSWTEFSRACDVLKFHGNRGGAWCALDADYSGAISMDEFDLPSAQLLASFKEWSEKNFGSVELAFKTLDPSGVGTITYQDLKRACHRLRWQGDVKQLYECLDCDDRAKEFGTKTMSLKEVGFLDTWEDSQSAEQQAEEHVVCDALSKTSKSQASLDNVRFSVKQHLDSHHFSSLHYNLDGKTRQHRRGGIIKQHTREGFSSEVILRALNETHEDKDGLRPASAPSGSITGVRPSSRASSTPSLGSMYLHQPKPFTEKMSRLSKKMPSRARSDRHPLLCKVY